MSRARELSKLANPSVFSVDSNNNVGVNSTTPDAKLDVVGVVSATQFFGDGSELSGITAGATLSAGSGDQRVVITSLTSGTMTAAATDAELSYNSGTNTLSATNISIAGTLTYEDVTNVDSIGVVTARNGIHVTSGNVGIATASPDNQLHVFGATTSAIKIETGDGGFNPIVIQENPDRTWHTGLRGDVSDSWVVRDATASSNRLVIDTNGEVKVGSAFSVGQAGVVTATSYHGDGSQLTGISAGISTGAASGGLVTLNLTNQDHKVTATGITTITVTGGTEGDSHSVRVVNSGISTVGFSTYFLFPSGSTPVLPTADGAISLISFTVHRAGSTGIATQLLGGAALNFS